MRAPGIQRDCMGGCTAHQSALIDCCLMDYVPKSNVLSILNVSNVCYSSLKSYMPFIDVDEDANDQNELMHR